MGMTPTHSACSRAQLEKSLEEGQRRFQDLDFSSCDLSRIDLNELHFLNCILNDTNFTAAQLESSQWEKCRAQKSSFKSAYLTDAIFSGCNLTSTDWYKANL